MRLNLEINSGRKKSLLVQSAKLDEIMIIAALIIFAVSFIDFGWRPLEVAATFVYELFFGSSDYLNALVASRENLPRAMAITSIVIFSGLVSCVLFFCLIPPSHLTGTSISDSAALGPIKSMISLAGILLILCATYWIAMSISTFSDGKFKSILQPIIMSDAGLGIMFSIILTAAAFFISVIAKTTYTIISSAIKGA